jgi:hypothetical protein
MKTSLLFLPIALFTAGCAVQRFESPPPGANTAEVVINFSVSSSRNVVLGGAFDEGKTCSGFRFIGVDGRATPVHRMRVEAKTLTLSFLSAGEGSGSLFGPEGFKGKKCGGLYTFDPKAGSQYILNFIDEPARCAVHLAELVDGIRVDKTDQLARREAVESMPGSNRCSDPYKPRSET